MAIIGEPFLSVTQLPVKPSFGTSPRDLTQHDQKCKLSGHFIALPQWVFNTGVCIKSGGIRFWLQEVLVAKALKW